MMGEMGWAGFGIGMFIWMLIWLGLVIWFVVFTILVVAKLNKIIELLEKK